MMSKLLILDYQKCQPGRCESGVCAAAQACTLHLIEQEEPYNIPMLYAQACRGCMKCAQACPFDALEMV
ncbi:MAG TPA: 4Fe-4S binding protein [Candidatus Limnocylindrales bacterium]|nr:4Fe-4S binding protein [Candidatus Limnocylindrales bacterium]